MQGKSIMEHQKQSMLQYYVVLIILIFILPLHAQHTCKDHKSAAAQMKNRDASNSIDLDPRVDSLAILHYTIAVEFPETSNTISGYCELLFKALDNNISSVTLDFENLVVDSIVLNNVALPFSHNNGKINISLNQNFNVDDEFSLRVYYGGEPYQDPAGFGGFYFTAGYAFNLGVSLTTSPHTFGRAWFPCFDNFITRSTYTLHIKTFGNKTSFCGGILANENLENGALTRTWEINQTIPTYLVSVAVAPYTVVNQTFESILGNQIPVMLSALPDDTNNLKNSFVNLASFFNQMEIHFGAYQWDRVGFVMVPFNSGAMEHAMNVAYPLLAANGTLLYQGIMAHEMAHSWFGNLVTCLVAEEMWLNEGFASYTEYLQEEWLYGENNYRTGIRNNHRRLLNFAHVRDNGYWALSNVPQSQTYGEHSYNKGADIIHTLRTYMGDEAFFDGLKIYIAQNAFDNATSATLQQSLEQSSGQDLSTFFVGWIHQAGWPHFSIDSLEVSATGSLYNVVVHYRQKLVEATEFLENVPMQITFMGENWEQFQTTEILSGERGTIELVLAFHPKIAFLNDNEKISHAVTAENRTIKLTAGLNLNHALFELIPQSVSDSTFIRIEHNWVAPDGDVDGIYRLSPNRYYTVKGISSGDFIARGRVYYNGRTNNTTSGWLDHDLVVDDTKVVILYRKNAGELWKLYPSQSNTTFANTTDKYGFINIDTLQFGEYSLAVIDSALAISDIGKQQNAIKIFPNPAFASIKIQRQDGLPLNGNVELLDMQGRAVLTTKVNPNMQEIAVDAIQLGIYFVRFTEDLTKSIYTQKLILIH